MNNTPEIGDIWKLNLNNYSEHILILDIRERMGHKSASILYLESGDTSEYLDINHIGVAPFWLKIA